MGVKGVRILLDVHDRVGTLLGITKIMNKSGVNIISDIGFESGSTYLHTVLIRYRRNAKSG
ncbi:hypothetical protein [Halalkalibacter alkalisediminis]|uniref:hypothetical protein n=1 Tax=Halalkalibacter alkalisediminis TaxID=935616 RepID=UPI002360751B|nr:hypothetical protein [Halalkalibacter alkalisediminis]